MITCDTVQALVAEEGEAALAEDPQARAHVEGCADCTRFVAALRTLDTALQALPADDAPPALVDAVAHAVGRSTPSSEPARPPARARTPWAAALAACVVVAAVVGLTYPSYQFHDRAGAGDTFDTEVFKLADGSDAGAPALTSLVASAEPEPELDESTREYSRAGRERPSALLFRDLKSPRKNAGKDDDAASSPKADPRMNRLADARRGVAIGSTARAAPAEEAPDTRVEQDKQAAALASVMKRVGPPPQPTEAASEEMLALPSTSPVAPPPADSRVMEMPAPGLGASMQAPRLGPTGAFKGFSREYGETDAAPVAQSVPRPPPPARQQPASTAEMPAMTKKESVATAGHDVVRTETPRSRDVGRAEAKAARPGKRQVGAKDGIAGAGSASGARNRVGDGTAGPASLARAWLAGRERLDGLAFQDPAGYWANTYVPGDPALRLLAARLERWERRVVAASRPDAALERAARPNWQPFDAPRHAALAAYLHADRRGITGPSRVRVQVGLQASERRGGRRPAMNIGVVLDLRAPLDTATQARIRALVTALERARQPGDRFALVGAGRGSGLLVEPGRFRHGPLRVTLDHVLGPAPEAPTASIGLAKAVLVAAETVRAGDDPESVLGASLVLLVSTSPIGTEATSIATIAHDNAVAGISLSAVALGAGADVDALDRIVLAGQGHRRVLETPDAAADLVDHELHAASRAVARAVRLRIRLAPGVQLVRVVGSQRLADPAAERVREAERSIDQRLSRNLGIRADRGEDEEGIQIVIPSFFAGDAHVVLLDVVAEHPGPVADVTVRYKDLVTLGNGVTRTSLALENGERPPGPLERNVLKNALAHELAGAAAEASRRIAVGDPAGAAALLSRARALLAGMRATIPGWEADPELLNDESMLDGYLAVLRSPLARSGDGRRGLANSLDYAAVRRLVPVRDE